MKLSVILAAVRAVLLIGFGLGIPRAIVHIGPPKTASSYIQSTLHRITKDLNAANFYWPTHQDGKSMGPKGVHSYFQALIGEVPLTEIQNMKEFLQRSLHLNRSIILSSEGLGVLESQQITQVKEHLKGFNTTIVFVYRDTLSHVTSVHFEQNRFEHAWHIFSSSFSSFILMNWDNLPVQLRPLSILDRYSAAFGQQHLRIIDLAGTTAAGRDVAHVILCQIAGILCNRTDLFHVKTFKNLRQNLVPSQVFSFYKAHVAQHECSFCTTVLQEHNHFVARYSNRTSTHGEPEIISSHCIPLRPFAERTDSELRAKYSAQILWGNQTANYASMLRVNVSELHKESFIQNLQWNKWIRDEYQLARTTGRLCNCAVPGPSNFRV